MSKIILMNTMKILCAGLLMIEFASSAQAESPLSTLPFGMEIGKKISDQIAGRCYSENTKEFNCKGKFRGVLTKDKKLKSLVFAGVGYNEALPTRWKKLGLYMRNGSENGVSEEKVLQIIRNQGAVHIETRDERYLHYIEFDLAGKYHFAMVFRMKKKSPSPGDGGLWFVRVNGTVFIEDY